MKRHRKQKEFRDEQRNLHMLQCGMKYHAPDCEYHVGNVKHTKSFLKPLSKGICKANKCKKNARNI